MTVSNPLVKMTYLGDGQNRRFDVPFSLLESEHLRLTVTTPDGAQMTPRAGEFTVAPNKDYVIYPAEHTGRPPLAEGFKITLYRETPATQLNDLIQQNVLQKETLEKSLDKLTMLAQEVQERLTRTVTVGIDENPDGVSVEDLVAQMRELYGDIKNTAEEAKAEAQKAIAAAVEAYEQAEKLYSSVEYYTAGTAALDYTGDLQTFKLYGSYKADGMTLKVFVNGLLKRRGLDYDYMETVNPTLAQNGDDWGDTIIFNSPLNSGDAVVFMWGDTLTMPGGEVAQAAALAAENAQAQAAAAAASAQEAKDSAGSFIPKPVGEIYYSQSALAKDNPGAVPGWTGAVLAKVSQTWPALLNFVKAHPERQISASEYTNMLSAKKLCPFYVLNEAADTLRLPTYSRFIGAVREDGAPGAHTDKMRPITGQFYTGRIWDAQGAFEAIPGGDKHGGHEDWDFLTTLKLNSASLGEHFSGTETEPAHAREFPWIVAANSLEGLIKHNGGFITVKGYTKEEWEALAVKPENELSLVEEDDE
uniref:Uncharacterized protein n=1 Tax=uncultured Elusimicrobia bacterium TaxID=699876 RepID=A0A650ELQ6_9BACT|nr:hypothetical protein Elusimicrob1349_1200 [uncultured Elusimicrobia bacterium]